MPRRKKDIDDGLDSSSESDKELFEISDTLLQEERDLFEDPSRRHKRRKNTKEDAYLGIWAEHDDDIRPNRKKNDVQFVASTLKSVTVENDTTDISSVAETFDEEVDSIEDGSRGLGITDTISRITTSQITNDPFKNSLLKGKSFHEKEDFESREDPGLSSSRMNIDDEDESLTTTLDEMLNIQFSSTKRKGKSKYGTTFQQSSTQTVDKDFGKFEEYTKGIGSKLMQKMGYKLGEGLGSDGSGIVKPIETQLRPARMGLAYHGFKEKTKQARADEEKRQSLVDDEEDIGIKPAKREKSNAWKKSAKPKKPKAAYKTADEIINEISSGPSVHPTKIIDYTGPEARVISSASQINSSLAIPDTSTRLPELRHNLRLIVDMSKADLEHFTRERRIQAEKAKTLREKVVRVTAQVDDETARIKRLGEIISIIKDCGRRLTVSLSSGSSSLELFSDAFEKLQNEYSDEFTAYGLNAAVIAIITPAIKQSMIDWEPLGDPNFGLLEFQKWKGLFRTSPPITSAPSDRFDYNSPYKRSGEATTTPYESMMFNVWLPKIRSAINNTWNARDYDPAIKLLENWKPPLLPMFIYDNIIDQLIMPKLTREVDSWNPNTDTQMIHQWLHPWLPLLGERMEPLYLTIRQKLRSSLQRWDPIDASAFDIIEPWKNVFKPKDMRSFVVKAVLPKLTEIMKEKFQMNPKNQELGVFDCVMIWRDLFTPKVFNQLFEDTFFPKWLDALYIWLIHSPNYGEIRQWYLFWKSLFPKEMLDSPIIEEQLMKALYMIEQSISLGSEASVRLPHPSQGNVIPEPEQFRFPPEESANTADITFFEIVEEFAQDRNVLFLPTNKNHVSGKPLYRMGGTPEGVGGLLMYLSDDVMYVKEDQNWTPMGFEEVSEKLQSSKR